MTQFSALNDEQYLTIYIPDRLVRGKLKAKYMLQKFVINQPYIKCVQRFKIMSNTSKIFHNNKKRAVVRYSAPKNHQHSFRGREGGLLELIPRRMKNQVLSFRFLQNSSKIYLILSIMFAFNFAFNNHLVPCFYKVLVLIRILS